MIKFDVTSFDVIVLYLLVVIPLIVVVNTFFLRAAVDLSNKILGAGSRSVPNNAIGASASSEEPRVEPLAPYAMMGKAAAGESSGQLVSPIREPSLGNACGMIVASAFAAFALQSPVESLARLAKVAPLPMQILSSLAGLFAMAGIYSAMLPAKYSGAVFVAIIHLLFVAVVGVFFTALVMAVN